jgi:hypothetical protein
MLTICAAIEERQSKSRLVEEQYGAKVSLQMNS